MLSAFFLVNLVHRCLVRYYQVGRRIKDYFMVVVKSQQETKLVFSLGLMTHLKFECRALLVNPKGKQKQRDTTCNTLFLKWAELPCEDGIWRFEQNRDVTQHEIPTVFNLFSMQEHTYRWLTVKMPYIKLPKYLVHFRWWKDIVKIVITIFSCSCWFIDFFFFFCQALCYILGWMLPPHPAPWC